MSRPASRRVTRLSAADLADLRAGVIDELAVLVVPGTARRYRREQSDLQVRWLGHHELVPGYVEVRLSRTLTDAAPPQLSPDPTPWRHVGGARVADPYAPDSPQGGYVLDPRPGYSDYPSYPDRIVDALRANRVEAARVLVREAHATGRAHYEEGDLHNRGVAQVYVDSVRVGQASVLMVGMSHAEYLSLHGTRAHAIKPPGPSGPEGLELGVQEVSS